MVRGPLRICAAATVLLARLSAAEHPVAKVVGLLQKLGEQVESEHKAEEVTYTKFERWCGNSKKTLSKAIEEEKASMDRLDSEIESHTKNIEVLGSGIKKHEKELLELDATDGKAKDQRDDGKTLYDEESKSLEDTIKAIGEAITALQEAKGSTSAFLLAQQRAKIAVALAGSRATPQQLAMLQRFMEDPRPDVKAKGDYKGHVDKYSFKSDNIVDLLKELKLKFEDELTATNTAETNAINAHELAQKARDDLRAAAKAAKTEKETAKGEAETAKAQAEGDYDNVKGDLAADSKALDQTEKTCDVKKSEWAERSETRTKEKEAIEAAIKILAKVTGVRTEAPENPSLPASPLEAAASPDLLQQGAAPIGAQRALNLLRSEAKAEHSKALDKLADSLEARLAKKGPFDDIINMIQKMIFREMHAQKEEDEHKAWCDLELNKTNASIEDKQAKIDELALKIEEHEASALELLKEIKEADEMVGKINEHMEEATEIRKVGKQENKLAIKDAQEAQVALANAVAVLKDFYKSSGQIPKESFELLQRRVNARAHAPVDLPETPSTWDSGYTGVADPSKQPDGIISVLETVSADFSRMASETEAQENSDQQAYDQDMKDCQIEKARRTKESEMKDQERKRINEQQATLEENHKNVKGEKEATEQYWKDLQPACVEGDSTYEERKAARATTIEALKTAQEILQSEGVTKAPKTFLQLRGARA